MIDYAQIKRSAYVLDEKLLEKNLEIIRRVQVEADVDIILAFKGFAMWSAFPMVRKYAKGATASSLHEARLCFEEMKSKAHTYTAAYNPDEFEEIMTYSKHICFNSVNQYLRYKDQVKAHKNHISCGIRVNPEYSEVETDLYNPCAPGSRLGATIENFPDGLPEGVEGLHFHALCESSSYELEKVLVSFENIFGDFIPKIKWLNVGGGHLMTRKDYDVAHLIQVLKTFKAKHPHLHIIMEPGSAFAWQTGVLVSNVLDVVENKGIKTIMLDVSFTAHMPDCLEMPYRPKIVGASDPVEGKPTYRIGGTSCLSGDYMENYSFEKGVQIGDQLIFEDMIHYTIVKTTMFNGVRHPDICIWRKDNTLDIVKRFEYEDYKGRMS
jgi:carboxynorspermidine decarboxylase